jgi:hypothetical protein
LTHVLFKSGDPVIQLLNGLVTAFDTGLKGTFAGDELLVLLVVFLGSGRLLFSLRELVLQHVDHVVFVLDDLLLALRLVEGVLVLASLALCLLQLLYDSVLFFL